MSVPEQHSSDLGPVRRSGLVDATIAQLREQITAGRWPVDTQLPIESELASTLKVGRNTLREAVRALVHAGLLDTRQGVGTFVRATDEVGEVLGRHVAGERLRDVLEVRRALETEASVLATSRATAAELAELDDIVRSEESAVAAGELAEAVEARVRFHLCMVEASHNPLLIRIYQGIGGALRASVSSMPPVDPSRPAIHRRLLEAIRAGDITEARKLADVHADVLFGAVAPAQETAAPGGAFAR